jgi:hypothetical protein
MYAMNLGMNGSIHTGPCLAAASPMGRQRERRVAAPAEPRVRPKAYCLVDERGRHVGTIEAPIGRPELGPTSPTVYLRRRM